MSKIVESHHLLVFYEENRKNPSIVNQNKHKLYSLCHIEQRTIPGFSPILHHWKNGIKCSYLFIRLFPNVNITKVVTILPPPHFIGSKSLILHHN
jgi:hypothetical protein